MCHKPRDHPWRSKSTLLGQHLDFPNTKRRKYPPHFRYNTWLPKIKMEILCQQIPFMHQEIISKKGYPMRKYALLILFHVYKKKRRKLHIYPRYFCYQVTKSGASFVLKDNPNIKLIARAHKMSKSRGNVVNPDDVVSEYGADSLRLYEMFMGPLR